MVILAKTNEVIVMKYIQILQHAGRYLQHSDKSLARQTEHLKDFFHYFGDSYFLLQKHKEAKVDMKHYLLATPEISLESKSLAGSFLDKKGLVCKFLTKSSCYLHDYTNPVVFNTVLSGREIFFTSFAEIPLSREGHNGQFKDFIDVEMRDALSKFNERAELWTSFFLFHSTEVLPSNVPQSHWWWYKTAEKKIDLKTFDY
ncbi:uncharacterized protein LOC131928104 isoform X2 [Physella acuta]|uniref:uncharacterized protein LOC131928104 isoform X2 n=1 Tax=Physella acuta TaxID=109671 RepID=UPI0027DC95AB|nr:uncharacterized protein LOC131928104 isoform X2 [Physella acuta]